MMEDMDPDTKSYFTFSFVDGGKQVTLNFNKQDARVPDVLEEFMHFMKACGYCFEIDDYFDVVNDFKDKAETEEELWESTNEPNTQTRTKTSEPNFPHDHVGQVKWVDLDGKEYTFNTWYDKQRHPFNNGFFYKSEDI